MKQDFFQNWVLKERRDNYDWMKQGFFQNWVLKERWNNYDLWNKTYFKAVESLRNIDTAKRFIICTILLEK